MPHHSIPPLRGTLTPQRTKPLCPRAFFLSVPFYMLSMGAQGNLLLEKQRREKEKRKSKKIP